MTSFFKKVLEWLINVFSFLSPYLSLVECKSAEGMETMKLTMPQTYENVLVIHRELPVLEVDTEH